MEIKVGFIFISILLIYHMHEKNFLTINPILISYDEFPHAANKKSQ